MNWATLEDVSESIVDGPFGSNLKTSDYVESGVPVLQGKNITGNIFSWHDIRYISDEKAKSLLRSATVTGDHLLIKIGSIGYSAILDCLHSHEYAIIPANMARIRPNRALVDDEYLHRVLTSIYTKRHLLRVASKTAQPALSLKKIKQTPIPLPPLPEQKRIAQILDAADNLRTKRRESIKQLDALVQSTFLEMFGDPIANPMNWEMVTIRELLVSATYGSSKKADLQVGNFPILRMNNITYSGSWDLRKMKYINLNASEQIKHLVHRGDLLFNRTNSKELVGKTAVFRESEPMAFAGYLVRGIVNSYADPEYIGAFMNTP